MSELKITPGPWILGESLEAFVYALRTGNDVNRMSLQVQGGYTDTGKTTREELDANARLIAAAPDLLSALESLLTAHKAYHVAAQAEVIGTTTAEMLFEKDSLVIEARAAIAKAKGE